MVTAVMPVSHKDIDMLGISLASIKSQVDRVVVVSDIPLNLDAEVLIQEKDGIGNARKQGILYADDEYIISADADTYYPPGYVKEAVSALEKCEYARAAKIYPLSPSIGAKVEAVFYPTINYEFALALRRSAFISHGLDKIDYKGRYDIGEFLWKIGVPCFFPSYVVTRLPTYAFKSLIDSMTVSIIGALGTIPIAVLLEK